VVKVGLGPLVRTLIGHGVVTHVALTAPRPSTDFSSPPSEERAEDVESGLADGSFGMAEETDPR